MKNFPRFLLFLLAALFLLPMAARKINTKRTNLHVRTDMAPDSACARLDTIAGDSISLVRFCGYEKVLRATSETLFIQNLSDSTILRTVFTIRYYDTSDRLIHSRTVSRHINIPPRETRRLDFPSWDKQQSYFYLHGPQPRRSATPYTVRISADSVFISIPDTLATTPCIPSTR